MRKKMPTYSIEKLDKKNEEVIIREDYDGTTLYLVSCLSKQDIELLESTNTSNDLHHFIRHNDATVLR